MSKKANEFWDSLGKGKKKRKGKKVVVKVAREQAQDLRDGKATASAGGEPHVVTEPRITVVGADGKPLLESTDYVESTEDKVTVKKSMDQIFGVQGGVVEDSSVALLKDESPTLPAQIAREIAKTHPKAGSLEEVPELVQAALTGDVDAEAARHVEAVSAPAVQSQDEVFYADAGEPTLPPVDNIAGSNSDTATLLIQYDKYMDTMAGSVKAIMKTLIALVEKDPGFMETKEKVRETFRCGVLAYMEEVDQLMLERFPEEKLSPRK